MRLDERFGHVDVVLRRGPHQGRLILRGSLALTAAPNSSSLRTASTLPLFAQVINGGLSGGDRRVRIRAGFQE